MHFYEYNIGRHTMYVLVFVGFVIFCNMLLYACEFFCLQVSYNSEALKIYTDLEDHWKTSKDLSEMKSQHQQTLSDIKALSITVD